MMRKEFLTNTAWMGKEIYHYEEIDSTNTQVRRLAEEGATHGTIVTAEKQTAGRGRRGRQWDSPKGKGLWFSILLRPQIRPEKAAMLTLVSALAVCAAIEKEAGISTQIKWPNDLVLSGRKVCGILTEMQATMDGVEYVIIGIGINVKNHSFPEELEQIATTLESECQREVQIGSVLERIGQEFETYYEKYLSTMDLSSMMEEYHLHLANKDRQVVVHDPKGSYEGIARGITPQGELLVEYQGTLQKINSGEVSVRGIYGYV